MMAQVAGRYRVYVVSAYDGAIFRQVRSPMTAEKGFTDTLKRGGLISPDLIEIKYVRSVEEYRKLFESPEPNMIVANLHGDLIIDNVVNRGPLEEPTYTSISRAVAYYGCILLSFSWATSSRPFSSWFLNTGGFPTNIAGVAPDTWYVKTVSPTPLTLSLAEFLSESIPTVVNASIFPGDIRPLYVYYQVPGEPLYGAAIFPFGGGVLIHVGLIVDDYTLGKIAALILMDFLSRISRGAYVSVTANHDGLTSTLKANVDVRNNNPVESLTATVILEVYDEKMSKVLEDRIEGITIKPREIKEVIFHKTLISMTPKNYIIVASAYPSTGKWASTTKIQAFSMGIITGVAAGAAIVITATIIARKRREKYK